jgi:hypothetical protein
MPCLKVRLIGHRQDQFAAPVLAGEVAHGTLGANIEADALKRLQHLAGAKFLSEHWVVVLNREEACDCGDESDLGHGDIS